MKKETIKEREKTLRELIDNSFKYHVIVNELAKGSEAAVKMRKDVGEILDCFFKEHVRLDLFKNANLEFKIGSLFTFFFLRGVLSHILGIHYKQLCDDKEATEPQIVMAELFNTLAMESLMRTEKEIATIFLNELENDKVK